MKFQKFSKNLFFSAYFAENALYRAKRANFGPFFQKLQCHLKCAKITSISSNKVVRGSKESWKLAEKVCKHQKPLGDIPCEPTARKAQKVVKVTILLQKTQFSVISHNNSLILHFRASPACATDFRHLREASPTNSSDPRTFWPNFGQFEKKRNYDLSTFCIFYWKFPQNVEKS